MTTRDSAPIGAPCWIDLMTTDLEACRTFYSQMFGWTAGEADQEHGGYFMFLRDGVAVAGAMPDQPGVAAASFWTVYLNSDDAAKTVDVATGAGAQPIVGPMPVGDEGVMAVVLDPGGAPIGIWQPRNFAGITVLDEPGTQAWFELLTRDYDAAVEFYRDVFRWDAHTMSDAPEFRYTTLGEGEHALAGIMDARGFLDESTEPPHWSVYFRVEDTDAALERVAELGGSMSRPAQDSPYGRLATVADPTGVAFNLMGPNRG